MEEQKSTVFRQKTLDSISSPEQLTDYLKVTHVGIWVILAAVILLLCGLFVWSMVGDLETVVSGTAVVRDGRALVVVTDGSKGKIESGMTMRVGSEEYTISSVETDDYGRTVAYVSADLPDAKYDVRIVTESIHPIQFLFS